MKKFKKGDIIRQYDEHWKEIYLLIIDTKYDPEISDVSEKEKPHTYVVKCIKDTNIEGEEPDYTGEVLNWYIGINDKSITPYSRRTWTKISRDKAMVELL